VHSGGAPLWTAELPGHLTALPSGGVDDIANARRCCRDSELIEASGIADIEWVGDKQKVVMVRLKSTV
jgi:hypothetical protein